MKIGRLEINFRKHKKDYFSWSLEISLIAILPCKFCPYIHSKDYTCDEFAKHLEFLQDFKEKHKRK